VTASIATIREDHRWYYLAVRHLRMAFRLLRDGFADGAVFHSYHAYECVLSAFIAANGYPVPPEGWTSLRLPSGKPVKAYSSPQGPILDKHAHKARIVFFELLADQTKAYYATHARLRTFITYQDRNYALYYDPVSQRLPHQRYQATFTHGLLPILTQFAREVRVTLP
jgi:hypothetical protein